MFGEQNLGSQPPPVPAVWQRLLDELAERQHSPTVIAVRGCAESGKSELLNIIAARGELDGRDVRRSAREITASALTERSLIVIDDAELLSDADHECAARNVETTAADIVFASRPHPASRPFQQLLDIVERRHPSITLQPMTPRETQALAAHLTGATPELVDAASLCTFASGYRGYVRALLEAQGTRIDRVPDGLVAKIRDRIDGLHDRDLSVLTALTAGFVLAEPRMFEAYLPDPLAPVATRLCAAGLLDAREALIPLVQRVATSLLSATALSTWRLRLVDQLDARGLPFAETALALARAGVRHQRVTRELIAAADESMSRDPARAEEYFSAARESGAREFEVAGRLARVAWARGDVVAAGRSIDHIYASASGFTADSEASAVVAASVWADRGFMTYSAGILNRLDGAEHPVAARLASVCFLAIGDLERAQQARPPASDAPLPTTLRVATGLMSEGMWTSLDTDANAVEQFVHASAVLNEASESTPIPEVPAVLAVLGAVQQGDFALARSVIGDAIEATQGGVAFRMRLALMRAWIEVQANNLDQASALLADVPRTSTRLRDAFVCAATELAIARRRDDTAAVKRLWPRARDLSARMAVDAFALPFVGEVLVAAARIQQSHRVQALLTEATALCTRLGNAPLWCAHIHWSAITAGILRAEPAALAVHADALTVTAQNSLVSERLAAAGKVWVDVLGGCADVNAVENAVRGLVRIGKPWDAGRIAAHAATRAAEHDDTLRLLAFARNTVPVESPAEPRQRSGESLVDATTPVALSDREREVARLVVAGKTYAQIGQEMYISPRTAEHHIARIRQRFGASSRSEMLSVLRDIFDAE